MHVLYVHQNFPAQFGHIATRLIQRHGFRCTFTTTRADAPTGPIEKILYKRRGGATGATHFASRMFENYTWQTHAVFEALKQRSDLRPDVIVGHSGFGSTLFLNELFTCPVVSFCEWFYHWSGGDGEFLGLPRQETESTRLTVRCRNAALLADLNACTVGYCPTHWQRSRIPHEYQHKLETIFDGIDTTFWRPLSRKELGPREIAGTKLPKRTRIVTYVSRGFESIRGFDVFMQVARRICEKRPDVVFLCIGSDKICYGGDAKRIREGSFREHVLRSGRFDLDRFIFTGPVPPTELRRAFAFSDLHIYLTAPFILSWSLMDALACGCAVLVSDTPPLREVMEHGQNGLMAPFFDVEHMAELALEVLDDPPAYRRALGEAGMATIHQQYDLDVVLPRMIRLYERAIHRDVPKPSDSSRVAGASRVLPPPQRQGLAYLRRAFAWPPVSNTGDRRPSGRSPLRSSTVADLRAMVPATANTILHVGAWTGQITEVLAQYCQTATIIATDTWSGGIYREPVHPEWKAKIAWAWRAFADRMSPLRDRVIALPHRHNDGVRYVAACGVRPDVIFYDPDYDSGSVRDTLQAVVQCFPDTTLVGDDWLWHGVQGELSRVAARSSRRLIARGNLWRLEPALQSAKRQAEPSSNGHAEQPLCTNRAVAGRVHAEPRTANRLPAVAASVAVLQQDASDVRPLRVLAVIPHFFRPNSSRLHRSGMDGRDRRVAAVRACLTSLYETLCSKSYTANLARPENLPANSATKTLLHLVMCISGDYHVLNDLDCSAVPFETRQTAGDPRFLGYACHEVLRDRVGDFDYYVYLEDDLVLQDAWVFAKLRWFCENVGNKCLLQPNRYEVAEDGSGRKAYIDGDLPLEKTARYQDVTQQPVLKSTFLGTQVMFQRTLNPHAGCFFLNAEQMRVWSKQPYFLDRDATFYTALEGAATAGIMRTFRVYKPARENANFFEIRHFGDAYLRKLADRDHRLLSRMSSRVQVGRDSSSLEREVLP